MTGPACQVVLNNNAYIIIYYIIYILKYNNIVTSTKLLRYTAAVNSVKKKSHTYIYAYVRSVIKIAAAVAAVAVVRNIKLNHGRWHGRNNGFRHSTLSGRVRRRLSSRSRTFCTGIFYSIRFFFRHSDNHHHSLWFAYWCTNEYTLNVYVILL